MDSSSNTSSETLTLNSVSYSMERTEEQSLTSYSDPTPYDVFLSFNGKNSRYKFTSHLYEKLDSHGIRTYMDDPELRVGEVISEALIQAIKDSKIYVAVFTENYADSSWCLDELVEMYKCYQTHQRLIIGVYCNIDPSVVRHQTDSFKEAFKKHETDREGCPKVQADKTNQWRTTLGNVAAFSGKHISSQRSEADVVNEILERILLEINPKALHVTRHPVGMNTRVKEITTLLRTETKGVLMFGIYGMRGVGKTTLAKAVYNQLLPNFKGSCCFLADVREVSGITKGLASLQQQLINDVLKSKKTLEVHSVDQGIKLIDARICKTKVLVVIDDVDKKEQVYSLVRNFESGSVVILTTTDEAMLGGINVEPQFRYRLQRLDDVEARSLFSKYAFENGKVNNTLMQCFYKRIQELADGLPLALAVFGSYLCDQHDDEGWRSYINKLELNPDTDINGRLLITLNAIEREDPMLKILFLDIACFFVGKPKKFTLGILETYYVYVAHKIDILKKRSLLTINRKGVLGMHGLLQDMGRDAVRNNFPHDQPQKHSRLWAPKDICDVLEEGKGTDVIEGIIPYDKDANEEITFSTTETFKKMINLRFLHLRNVNLDGSFQQRFGSLRWLRWDCCLLMELPSEFLPKKLVALELRDSKIKKWELNKVFVNLKTLNMSNSINLTTMPDFAKLPNLETLTLNGCESLEKVDIPINSLTKLVSFHLRGCMKLRSIHVISTSSLGVMEVLDVSRCEKLEKLPHQLCEIISLRKIYLGTRHEYLEAPFKHLNLSENEFTALPSSYSHFLKLEHLQLCRWPNLLCIEHLPPNLKELNLYGCKSLVRLPNLSSLTQLEHLDLSYSSILMEIEGLEKLTSIRELGLSSCNSSLHANILTAPLFQNWSQVGSRIIISVQELPSWFPLFHNRIWYCDYTIPSDVGQISSMIICLEHNCDDEDYDYECGVENVTTGEKYSDDGTTLGGLIYMIILPALIISLREGDKVRVTSDGLVRGIHLV